MFRIQLVVGEGNAPAFKPAFGQVERLAEAVLDGAVRTTFDIPRAGTQMMVAGSVSNSTTKTAANSIPTMALDDDELVQVCAGRHAAQCVGVGRRGGTASLIRSLRASKLCTHCS